MESVLHVPAFKDNYVWLIRGASKRHAAIVDPGDGKAVLRALAAADLIPVAILCTHHHWDHSDGIPAILAQHPVPVYGPAREPVEGMSHGVAEGDRVVLDALGQEYRVLDTPGHTAGHIAFVGHGRLFCGDTLFSAGCGRLFEGTAAQMHASLAKLAALPDATEVFCGHEYTLANLRFARTVEPDNADIAAHFERTTRLRAQGLPTLPSTIGLERRINPFLRTHEPAVVAAVSSRLDRRSDAGPAVLATLRRWKDDFKG